MTSNSIIAFAKKSSDRDFLKAVFRGWARPVLFFESEANCFDNLLSVKPKMIVIKTNSTILVWRFVFALHVLKVNSQVFVVTNDFDNTHFNLDGIQVNVQCRAPRNEGGAITESLRQIDSNCQGADLSSEQELLIGQSSEIKRINASLAGLKASSDPILITGEAGAGKELLARRIVGHTRDESIFIKVNCSYFKSEKIGFMGRDEVIRIGKAVLDDAGSNTLPRRATILFDKIDRLSQSGQSEVLALLEDGLNPNFSFSSSFRIIATAEADLEQLVTNNRFRQDLYYRLNVIPVNLPPLRQRREDIPLLIDYMAIQACSRLQKSYILVSPQAVEKLHAYQWPGNVDELKKVVLRFAVSGSETHILAHIGNNKDYQGNSFLDHLDGSSFPNSLEIQGCLSAVGSMPLKSICDKFIHQTEKVILQKALEATKWNRKKAAELLNISYKSMLNKMKAYDII